MKLNDHHRGLIAEFEDYCQSEIVRRYSESTKLHQAIRYAMEGTGKRVRPLLCLLSCQAVGGQIEDALPACLAVEMIHTYSLIHDDLPAMDDDSIRRGRNTLHVEFDEATAILAGDALLTDSFHVISHGSSCNTDTTLQQILSLAGAAGGNGMVLGQDFDMHWTKTPGYDLNALVQIHENKTGALMGASAELGCLAGGGDVCTSTSFRDFGKSIGVAFQVTDDLLDVRDGIGKSRNKDVEADKLTILKIMNIEKAEEYAKRVSDEALSFLHETDAKTEEILALTHLLLQRDY